MQLQSTNKSVLNYQTCQLGCHDVCDLLLVSMAKLQDADRTLKGRFRAQMRRPSRPLLQRVMLHNWIKRLCDVMAKEAGLDDEGCSVSAETDLEVRDRKRPADNVEDSPPQIECQPVIEKSINKSAKKRRRLNSLVLVTENYQPVSWSAVSNVGPAEQTRPTRRRSLNRLKRRRQFHRFQRQHRPQREYLFEMFRRES